MLTMRVRAEPTASPPFQQDFCSRSRSNFNRAQGQGPMAIRILIADDNAIARGAVSRVIRSAGENWEICYEAVDGRAAVEKAMELRPDLLILDLLMPYDGISAGRRIREFLPSTPMVLNTIWSSAA